MLSTVARRSLIALAVLGVPSMALADHRFDTDRGQRYERRSDSSNSHRRDSDARDHGSRDQGSRTYGHVNIEIRSGGYERVPEMCEERVWVEPVYRTVCDRIWVEPVMQKVHERVWVPDRYECREVVRWECGRRIVRREEVLVERGHYQDVCRDVVVSPGHYEDRPRQELVCAGHYETRRVARPVEYRESHARIGVLMPPKPPPGLPPLPPLPFPF
jgi:hypothetical protein